MGNSCSEKFLIEQLKQKLQQETGRDAAEFDEALRWWKHTCSVQFSGEEQELYIEPLLLKDLKEHEKLPTGLHRRLRENEERMGIQWIRCAARVDDAFYDERVNLRITGTFVGSMDQRYLTLMVMVYNGRGELMDFCEAGYTLEYEDEENTFDEYFSLPVDEWIGAIETRFVPDTVIF